MLSNAIAKVISAQMHVSCLYSSETGPLEMCDAGGNKGDVL